MPRVGDFGYEKLKKLIIMDKFRTGQGDGQPYERFEVRNKNIVIIIYQK